MAKSGSFYKTFSTGYRLLVEWSESNVDIANNQSDITVTAKLVSLSSSYNINSTASKNISLTINGTKYSSTCTVGLSGGAAKTLMTKTVSNINHSSDGSKSISISCTLGIAVTLSGKYVSSVSTSGTATLTKIARAAALVHLMERLAQNRHFLLHGSQAVLRIQSRIHAAAHPGRLYQNLAVQVLHGHLRCHWHSKIRLVQA